MFDVVYLECLESEVLEILSSDFDFNAAYVMTVSQHEQYPDESAKWNSVTVILIIYTCVFPAIEMSALLLYYCFDHF